MQTWKDVVGYEGLYAVSSDGVVKSVENPDRATHRSEHVLKLSHTCGYSFATLCKGGKAKRMAVHRIVALAFIPKLDDKDQVDHINGIRNDNRVENLRWCTGLENNGYSLARLHKSESKRGDKNPNYGKDLSERVAALRELNMKPVKQLDADGNIIAIYESRAAAGKATSIHPGSIARACCGTRKTAGGYFWQQL